MRRHAKASSAGSNLDQGSRPGSIRRAFATRGASSGDNGSGASSRVRAGAGVTTLAIAIFALLAVAPAAFAGKIVDRIVAGAATSGTLQGQFNTPRGVAINDPGIADGTTDPLGASTNGYIYVADQTNHRIQVFGSDGSFKFMFGRGVQIGGDGAQVCDSSEVPCKVGIADDEEGEFNNPQAVAINQETGDVYVRDRDNRRIQQFTAAGVFIRTWGWDVTVGGTTGFEICTVGCKVGVTGANGGQFATASGANGNATGIAVDPAAPHNVFVIDPANRRVEEFEADGDFLRLWGWDVVNTGQPGDVNSDSFEVCTSTVTGVCKGGSTASFVTQNGRFGASSPLYLAIDGASGMLYVSDSNKSNRVLAFDTDEAAPAQLLQPEIPVTSISGTASATTTGLNVDQSNGNLLVARSAAIGVLEIANPTTTPTLADTHLVGSGLTLLGFALHPGSDEIYLTSTTVGHRLFAADDDGAAPALTTVNPPSGLGAHEATITGSVTPAGPPGFTTSYRFQYSRNGTTWTDAGPEVNAGEGNAPVAAGPVQITGLEGNTFYRVRLVTRKAFGNLDVPSAELTFLTDAISPEVQTFYPQEYTDTTARMTGQINANNLPTTYYFEYGETASYGSKVPVPDGTTSGGTAKKILSQAVGLKPETTYHYRLVASNSEGTAKGGDVAFTTRSSAGADARAYEMVTPAFKATRLSTPVPSADRFNGNPGIPSLDGDAIGWDMSTLPLTDEVRAPAAGDRRLFHRTPQGWVSDSLNTLRFVDAQGEPTGAILTQQNAFGSSGDLQTQTWGVTNGSGPGLLATSGRVANILYTRRIGTGTEGFTPWLTNPEEQFFGVGFGGGEYQKSTAQIPAGDNSLFNDDGTALLRAGSARGLAENADTVGDDDPSDEQQLPGQEGGAAAYLVRAANPDDLPSAPKDLIGECTGTGAGATQIPARVGSGSSATDTIGSQACDEAGAPEATGTGMRTVGSPVLTGVTTSSGSFSVGQTISGTGIPGGTTIAAVGAGTLTLSANAKCGPGYVTGNVTNGSPVVTGLKPPSCGVLQVGQTITGTGIPGGTTIVGVSTTALTLSANATTSQFTVTLVVPGAASTALTAGEQHLTSKRGTSLGAGFSEQGDYATGGVARTALSNDGRRVFFESPDPTSSLSTPSSCQNGSGVATDCPPQLYVRQYDSDGVPTVRWISQAQGVGTQQVGEMGRGVIFEGASKDGRYVYFKTNAPLLPSDPNGGASITTGAAQDSSWDLYRYTLPASHDVDPGPPNGTLERISAGPTGTADPNTNRSTTVSGQGEAGAGGAARYLSDDGKRAYFLTTSPIAGADTTPAKGGITAPGGANGNTAVRNLYLFDDHETGAARWKFIAQLPYAEEKPGKTIGDDALGEPMNACASYSWQLGSQLVTGGDERTMFSVNCFRGTPDGKAVIFFTAAQLTADDNNQAGDIYLYQADTDELVRVTAPVGDAVPYGCKGTREIVVQPCYGDLSTSGGFAARGGGQGTAGPYETARGWSGMSYYNVAEDDQGVVSVFFESKSQLVPEDTNGDYYDVYQWRNGKLSLITPGSTNDDAWYSGSSLDGRDVFFFSSQRIDPREVDSSDGDVYDARIGGGIPYTPPATPCNVLAHECRGPASATPPVEPAASRSTVSTGNVSQTKQVKKCPKGKKRHKGKCVKKSKRATSTNRRAGR